MTPSPTSVTDRSPTPSPTHTCSSGWSTWLNRNSPLSATGDYEKMTKEELSNFCPGGQITDIKCVDSDQGDSWESLSEASCTLDNGLTCDNQPIDGIPPCRDYKIRYMCNCSGRIMLPSVNYFYKQLSLWNLLYRK